METGCDSNESKPAVDTDDTFAQLAGKYMTFKLANEEYGLEILRVIEIIGVMDITSVPRSSDFVRGVINLRGKVIPVADLRLLFGMDRVEATEQTVIIVVQFPYGDGELTMGILVDQVMEVLDITAGSIAPPPELGGSRKEDGFILGIGKADERVIFLLEIGRILSTEQNAEFIEATMKTQAA